MPLDHLSDDIFDHGPDPDNPGWNHWNFHDDTLFNGAVLGRLIVRKDGDACRLRMFPERRHLNLQGVIHGAVTMGLIDISLFSAMHVLGGSDSGPSVTLELSTQFVEAGKAEEPLDAVTSILRETGRLAFMRGEVVQGDTIVAAFSGIVRKFKPRS